MTTNNFNIKGLTNEQVILAREKFGQNTLNYKQENGVLAALKNLTKEPNSIGFVSVIWYELVKIRTRLKK